MAFLAFQSNNGIEDIWKWIASGLLAVLGWLLGKKDRRDALGENSWEKRGSEVLRRLEEIEKLTQLRADHPEYHPLSNYLNGKLGKYDNRIEFLEEDIKRMKKEYENGR